MISATIDAIAISIHKSFPKTKNYIEDVKQDFKKPCFFITLLSPSRVSENARSYKYDSTFMIQYFPASLKPNDEMHDVIDGLDDALELITVKYDGTNERKTRRISYEAEIASGILNYKVRYADCYFEGDSEDYMNTVDLSITGKG